MRERTRERFRRLQEQKAAGANTGGVYPTVGQMVGKLQKIGLHCPVATFTYQNQAINSSDPNVPWNAANIPVLDPGGQTALKQALSQKLTQLGGEYTNGGPITSVDNGGAGLILQTNLLVNPQTEGEVYTSNVSNLIVSCVYAYRVYRYFKRGRTGQQDFDEDEELLSEFGFVQGVLSGKYPNPEVDRDAIPRTLQRIYDKIFERVKEVISMPASFDYDRITTDERFCIRIQTMIQGLQNWAAWDDPITRELKTLQNADRYRDYDIICVLADSIKLYSKKSGGLQVNEVEGIDHAIQTINTLLEHMRATINNTLNVEIKGNLQLCYESLSRRVYTSIAKSLNEIMVRAIDDYYYKTQNQGKSPRSALLSLRRYNGLIGPAERALSNIEYMNERMEEYGDRCIDKDVQMDLTMNTDILRGMLGA